LPFAGLHQILHPVLAGANELPDPQRPALLAAFGADSSSTPDLFLIALGTLNLLSNAAPNSPILLVADDAQWLDPATADVLAFVARRLEMEPIVMLAAIRERHASPLLETDADAAPRRVRGRRRTCGRDPRRRLGGRRTRGLRREPHARCRCTGRCGRRAGRALPSSADPLGHLSGRHRPRAALRARSARRSARERSRPAHVAPRRLVGRARRDDRGGAGGARRPRE